jgi:uncharacterized membrane protein HdeD (DUF308 family)
MELLQRNWGWLLGLGVLMAVLGLLAIAVPMVATLAVEVLIAWLLLIGGVAQAVHAFTARGWRGFMVYLLGGILSLGVGLLMLLYPLQGAAALTIVLAAYLLVQGIFQTILAFQIRPLGSWLWMLLSGIVTLVLAILIWLAWPSSALWVIGLLVGIHLLFTGFSLITLALAARGPISPEAHGRAL